MESECVINDPKMWNPKCEIIGGIYRFLNLYRWQSRAMSDFIEWANPYGWAIWKRVNEGPKRMLVEDPQKCIEMYYSIWIWEQSGYL